MEFNFLEIRTCAISIGVSAGTGISIASLGVDLTASPTERIPLILATMGVVMLSSAVGINVGRIYYHYRHLNSIN